MIDVRTVPAPVRVVCCPSNNSLLSENEVMEDACEEPVDNEVSPEPEEKLEAIANEFRSELQHFMVTVKERLGGVEDPVEVTVNERLGELEDSVEAV